MEAVNRQVVKQVGKPAFSRKHQNGFSTKSKTAMQFIFEGIIKEACHRNANGPGTESQAVLEVCYTGIDSDGPFGGVKQLTLPFGPKRAVEDLKGRKLKIIVE
jgi:hypothetical protein